MSLGILNNIAAIYAENSLNQTQASLQTVLQQLSSGSRINSGADDAAGLAVVNGLQANEAALAQSAQNATNGVGALQTADGALAQVTSLLTRAVTLSTEAANSTLSAAQVSSANQEYQNILNEINAIGSTTNFSGNTVFSNTASNLFVSDGSVSGAQTISNTIGLLSTTGSTASVGETAATVTSSTTTLSNTVNATQGAPSASTYLYTFGSNAELTGDTLSGSLTIGLGTGSSVILSPTSTTLLINDINGNATLQSEGVSASSTGAVVTITGPASGQGGNLAITSTIADATSAGDLVSSAAGTSASPGQATVTLQLGAPTNTINGTFDLKVTATGSVNSITVPTGTTGQGLATLINQNAALQALGVSAAFAITGGNGIVTVTGPAGATETLSTTGTSLSQSSVIPPGTGVDFAAASISTLTSATAQAVLTSVTAAIADVAYQRGIIGANINQLTAASNVASTEDVNLTSASNAVQATNYGQATSDLAKFEVLSQTGISALAQANTVQQEILKLLQ